MDHITQTEAQKIMEKSEFWGTSDPRVVESTLDWLKKSQANHPTEILIDDHTSLGCKWGQFYTLSF